jgi:hypothetical protein
MSMDDTYTVRPHVLRKDIGDGEEQVAVANVDGINVLVVPLSEESARGFISASRLEGMSAAPVTIEDIEKTCAHYGLACVGLYGLEEDMSMDVLSVETLELALVES